jgi:diacylglycerol kinase family enzyme
MRRRPVPGRVCRVPPAGVRPGAPGRGRRLAAAAALAAPVAAVVAAVALTMWQPTLLVLLILAIPGAAVSAWYGMTRRGPLRVVALVVAVLAVGTAITAGVALFLVELVLLVVFAAAGGYALGPATEALLVCGCRARLAGPAERGVLLINPNSGGGKAARFNLPDEAARRGVRAVPLAPGEDLTQLAERAVADGVDVIGMAGGDGSQALVATVAMRYGLAFVCVPSGTRNHFALDLGLDRDDVAGALDAFTDAVERTVDLGRVNGHVFVNNASLGVYARVIQSTAYRDAKAGTWGRMLPELLGRGAAPMDLDFDGPDALHYSGAPFVLVSNNPYRLGGSGTVTRPRLDTGRLGILAAPTRRPLADLTALYANGHFRRVPGLIEWSLPSFEVGATDRVPVGIDGEALFLDPPLRFISLPGALRVRLPRHATGLVRATQRAALTRHDFAALFRIVAGRPPVPPDQRDQARSVSSAAPSPSAPPTATPDE